VKPGDLYNIGSINYMVLEIVDRTWKLSDDQGVVSLEKYVTHVKCMGPTGMEEFPLGWFSKRAEAIVEDE